MVCHYCGYEQPKIRVCPECGSGFIGEFKAGTQQIEEMVRRRFPQAKVLRMDMDTTKKKMHIQKFFQHLPMKRRMCW